MPFSAQFVGLLFAACVASATTYDFVVVGGGTAGVCSSKEVVVAPLTPSTGLVVANRLTANPLVSVMVLEAGGDGLGKCVAHLALFTGILNNAASQNISNVALIGAAFGTAVDWAYPTEPLQFAGNRSFGNVPRGKVLGYVRRMCVVPNWN